MRRFLLLLPLALAVLAGCVGSADSKKTPLIPPQTAGTVTNELLVYALGAAERVKDDGLKLYLLDRLTGLSIERGLLREAYDILSYAVQLFRRINNRYQYEEFGIAFAKRYIELGSAQAAEQLLREALDHAESLDEEVRKRLVFEEILSTGLSGGNPFQLLLRKTVDWVLVLDDPELKTDLLMDSAARFFEAGRLKDSRDLVQFTLSQIGSLDNPLSKAVIYSRLAQLYRQQRDDRRTADCVAKALAACSAAEVPQRSEQQAAMIAAVSANIYRLSYKTEALKVAETISYPWVLAEVLLGFGLSAPAVNRVDEMLIERSFETAAEIPDDAKRLSTLFRLDQLLIESGGSYDSVINFSLRAAELSSLETLPEWDDLSARFARLYLLTGDLESAVRVVRGMKDSFNRVAALLETARNALRGGKISDGYLLLEEGAALVDSVSRSRDKLLREIAAVYLELDETKKALAAVSEIEDPYPRAVAISDIVKYYLSAGKAQDAQDLRILKRLSGI